MQFGNDLSNRTLLIWWNFFVEKNKRETLERLFNKQYVVVQVLSCDILDHVADEIWSNKARGPFL